MGIENQTKTKTRPVGAAPEFLTEKVWGEGQEPVLALRGTEKEDRLSPVV